MVQNAVQLNSLSNSVWRVLSLRGSMICKRYVEEGLRNGLPLPLSRIRVEMRILEGLSGLIGADRDSLIVPETLRVDSHGSRLYMSDLGGVGLCHCSEAHWPSPGAWASLGRLCARLEQSSNEIAQGVSGDVWVRQDALRRLAVDRRICNVSPEQAHLLSEFKEELSPSVICLGDLCFANLLACDGRLGLVDVEFAHIGFAGRDIGRLAAQLNAETVCHPAVGRVRVQCRKSLLAGFADRGGNINHALWWTEILEFYYSDPNRERALLAL